MSHCLLSSLPLFSECTHWHTPTFFLCICFQKVSIYQVIVSTERGTSFCFSRSADDYLPEQPQPCAQGPRSSEGSLLPSRMIAYKGTKGRSKARKAQELSSALRQSSGQGWTQKFCVPIMFHQELNSKHSAQNLVSTVEKLFITLTTPCFLPSGSMAWCYFLTPYVWWSHVACE